MLDLKTSSSMLYCIIIRHQRTRYCSSLKVRRIKVQLLSFETASSATHRFVSHLRFRVIQASLKASGRQYKRPGSWKAMYLTQLHTKLRVECIIRSTLPSKIYEWDCATLWEVLEKIAGDLGPNDYFFRAKEFNIPF